jgi:hypothetical protein
MTLMIEFEPDIESRLREEAARQGQDVAEYVKALVKEKLGGRVRQPFYARATKEEWLQTFNAWLDSHDPNLPALPDEAYRRESFYGDPKL